MAVPHYILFTIPNFITAGSGQAMLNIIERLDRKRFSPGVCVARKGGDLDREVEAMGIPLIESPFTVPPKPYVTLLWRAWRASRAFVGARRSAASGQRSGSPSSPGRFTLWHSFHYADDYTESIIARMAGAKAWVFTKKNMGWDSRAWSLRSRFATRIAAHNSDMMRDFFGAGPSRAKARLIPRGVDSARFTPNSPSKLAVRAQRNIPSDSVVVTCVAQLVAVKGHPTLIQAMADLSEIHLIIAGNPLDQEYTASLRQQVVQLNLGERVHFLGGVKEVPALLAESDIFVLPTWARWRMEGCPVALIEAMACGKACVATDIPGSRDLVEHGKSGLLVVPEDPRALACALRQLVTSRELRRKLGHAARQRVLDRFTIQREVDAHEDLYEEVLHPG